MCFQDPATVTPEKVYIRKELVIIEKSISKFHTIFYITEIKKLAFHLPHVRIIGTNHFVKTLRDEFNRRSAKQDVLSRIDSYERLVASFSHQIQSKYYGGNIYVSIEYIVLEISSFPTHTETEGTPQARTRHAVFHSFF